MLGQRLLKFRQAEKAFDSEEYATAETLLEQLWQEDGFDSLVFHKLFYTYSALEKWDNAERLVNQYSQTLAGLSYRDEYLLAIYLGQKKVGKALEVAEKLIADAPDFIDNTSQIGTKFVEAGFEKEYVKQLETLELEGFNPNLALAGFYAYCKSDYLTAIKNLEKALVQKPADEDLLYSLNHYKYLYVGGKIQTARAKISGAMPGDAVEAYKEIMQIQPQSVTSQEYYLSAIACKQFPPFYVYFHENNFVGTAPYSFKAIVYFVFFVICSVYYKGGRTVSQPDQMQSVIWLFSSLVIVRHSVYPLFVQLLAFKYAPSYHLLKKPFDFIMGGVILFSWITLWRLSIETGVKGFDFILIGGFLSHIFLFDLADNLEKKSQKITLRIYGLVSIVLGLLAYYKTIDDRYIFFMFGAWLPSVVFIAIWDYIENRFFKNGRFSLAENDDPTVAFTKRLHLFSIAALLICIPVLFGSFRATAMHPNWWMSIFFPLTMIMFTLFAFTDVNGGGPNFGWLWNNKTKFRWLFLLFTLGMLASSLIIAPYSNIPIRQYWQWIPCVLAFLGSWVGLFWLHYRYRRL